ncbi:hypothetical protein LBMAG42_50780 [Deltaproteobacteria bacterium]|nr:hypothetical protein LBMAG42_50780 [Deltaproteobacteria bacterium]
MGALRRPVAMGRGREWRAGTDVATSIVMPGGGRCIEAGHAQRRAAGFVRIAAKHDDTGGVVRG